MHCSSRSIIGGLISTTSQRSATLPPGFLLPAFSSAAQTASFSSSTTRTARKDGNPARGISAIRRTGLNKKVKLSVDLENLPKPVLDPARRSQVQVNPDHGLWGFFNNDRSPLQTPEQLHAHGRGWSVQELRHKSWDDLHRLWWLCVKETNVVLTNEAERKRLDAGYGEYEAAARMDELRKTKKAIKLCLTERWYSWEEARIAAMEDEEVDLYADTEKGQPAYIPKEYTEDSYGAASTSTTTVTPESVSDAQVRENIAAETARHDKEARS